MIFSVMCTYPVAKFGMFAAKLMAAAVDRVTRIDYLYS